MPASEKNTWMGMGQEAEVRDHPCFLCRHFSVMVLGRRRYSCSMATVSPINADRTNRYTRGQTILCSSGTSWSSLSRASRSGARMRST